MNDSKTIDKEILQVLKYFDFFRFPLSFIEIKNFIGIKIEDETLALILDEMVDSSAIYKIKEYYLLADESERVERKLAGKAMASDRMKRARFISRLIMSFPFIRMVAISGSLSKGYADKSSDIDFFIVTTENQLWTARTLLHILKKITFLFKLEHSFCMNYFIANNHLALEEKNYFTAVELSTLIPIKGGFYYNQLMEKNNWIQEYVPNFELSEGSDIASNPKGLKWIFEKILGSKGLNRSIMNFTDNRWRKKWKARGFPENEYDLAFKTILYESKNHPSNNQKKVLEHMKPVSKK